jgi:arsenite methyltransferase
LDKLTRQIRRAGQFPYPHQAAYVLDNPLRRLIGRPQHVLESIALDGSERVLEGGPGPGSFSVEIARRLTTGHLHLFDLQPEMLAKARRKLVRSGFLDIAFHAGDAGEGFPDPDRLSVPELRELAEVEDFEFSGVAGSRFRDIVTIRVVPTD